MFTRLPHLIAACASAFGLAAALPAAAATPATNYSDMWYLPAESGWGISFVQHPATNPPTAACPDGCVYAVWYTYDPRVNAAAPDPTSNFVPLWIVLAGKGTWTTPTSFTGPVYVTNGVPFSQTGSNTSISQVGTFTFSFSDANNGTFAYNIAPPSNCTDAASCPAFGLPAFSGTKTITRQTY